MTWQHLHWDILVHRQFCSGEIPGVVWRKKQPGAKRYMGVIQQPLLFLNSILLLWQATGISKEGGLQA